MSLFPWVFLHLCIQCMGGLKTADSMKCIGCQSDAILAEIHIYTLSLGIIYSIMSLCFQSLTGLAANNYDLSSCKVDFK